MRLGDGAWPSLRAPPRSGTRTRSRSSRYACGYAGSPLGAPVVPDVHIDERDVRVKETGRADWPDAVGLDQDDGARGVEERPQASLGEPVVDRDHDRPGQPDRHHGDDVIGAVRHPQADAVTGPHSGRPEFLRQGARTGPGDCPPSEPCPAPCKSGLFVRKGMVDQQRRQIRGRGVAPGRSWGHPRPDEHPTGPFWIRPKCRGAASCCRP